MAIYGMNQEKSCGYGGQVGSVPSPVVEERRSIDLELERLRHTIDRTIDAAEQLAQRLFPVLGPEGTIDEAIEKAETPLCRVTADIRHEEGRVKYILESLNDLIDRVQV